MPDSLSNSRRVTKPHLNKVRDRRISAWRKTIVAWRTARWAASEKNERLFRNERKNEQLIRIDEQRKGSIQEICSER